MKLIRGDKILIIAGKDRGKTGSIARVLPRTNQVIITGLNLAKKHLKRSAKFPTGGIIDKPMPLNASNVMILDPKTNQPTRLGSRLVGNQKRRIARTSNEPLEEPKR